MRIHRLPSLAILLLGALPAWLRSEIELTGIISTSQGPLFYLADRSAGITSGFIPLQRDFSGYTLSTFDPSLGVLVLTQDGLKTEVQLKASRVHSALPWSVSLGGNNPDAYTLLTRWIITASFDDLTSDPTDLRARFEEAETNLAAARVRLSAGMITIRSMQLYRDDFALIQAKLVGDRIAFARVVLDAAERVTDYNRMILGLGVDAQIKALVDVRGAVETATLRLQDAEALTLKISPSQP